jgi:hypothetical protein
VPDDLLRDAADQQVREARAPGGRHDDRVDRASGGGDPLERIADHDPALDARRSSPAQLASDERLQPAQLLALEVLGNQRQALAGEADDWLEGRDHVQDVQPPAVLARELRRRREGAIGVLGEVVGDEDVAEERHGGADASPPPSAAPPRSARSFPAVGRLPCGGSRR